MKNIWNIAVKIVGTTTILFTGLIVILLIINEITKKPIGAQSSDFNFDDDFDDDIFRELNFDDED